MDSTEFKQIKDSLRDASIINAYLYFVILLFGVSGNILLQIIIIRKKQFHNSISILLFNLSLADTLFLIGVLPIQLYNALKHLDVFYPNWYYCYIYGPLYYFSFNSCMFNMIAITMERYIVICRPLQANALITKKSTTIVILLIWTLSLLSVFPPIHQLRDEECIIHVYAKLTAKLIFHILGFGSAIILTVINSIIVVQLRRSGAPDDAQNHDSQTKNRRQLAIMMVVVMGVFVCSLVPYRIIIITGDIIGYGSDEAYYLLMTSYFTQSLLFLNSSINPIIYALFSDQFRKEFENYLCRFYCRRREVVENSQNAKEIKIDEHTV